MNGNLAVVNTENYTAKAEYGQKCPTDAYSTRKNSVNYESFVKDKPIENTKEKAPAGESDKE